MDYSIVRSKKRKKTIAFCFERDGALRVHAPFLTPLRLIEKGVQKRAAWIAKERESRKSDAGYALFSDGALFPYLGHSCVLDLVQGTGECLLSHRQIRVLVPLGDFSSENLSAEVRLSLSLWLRSRARVLFKKRVAYWASLLGVSYKDVLVAKAVQRWGSCSADNVIRLSWRLMMLPLPVLDYVVLHELCHVRHKNHSVRFWGYLAYFMPDWRVRRRLLREWEGRIPQ